MPYTLQVLRLPPKFYSRLEIVHAKTSISLPRDRRGVSVRKVSDSGGRGVRSRRCKVGQFWAGALLPLLQHRVGGLSSAPLDACTVSYFFSLKAQVKTKRNEKKNSKIHVNVPICVKKLKRIFGFFLKSNSQFFKIKPDRQQTDHTDRGLREPFFLRIW